MQNAGEIRCRECNKLLGKGRPGSLEVKCPRCGELNYFSTEPQERAEIDTMEDRHV